MCRSTDTENTAYSSFRCMTLVQKETTGKGMLDWGQTLKGFKKKVSPQKSITDLPSCVVYHRK